MMDHGGCTYIAYREGTFTGLCKPKWADYDVFTCPNPGDSNFELQQLTAPSHGKFIPYMGEAFPLLLKKKPVKLATVSKKISQQTVQSANDQLQPKVAKGKHGGCKNGPRRNRRSKNRKNKDQQEGQKDAIGQCKGDGPAQYATADQKVQGQTQAKQQSNAMKQGQKTLGSGQPVIVPKKQVILPGCDEQSFLENPFKMMTAVGTVYNMPAMESALGFPPKIMANTDIENVEIVNYAINMYAQTFLGADLGNTQSLQFIDGAHIQFVTEGDGAPIKLGNGAFGSVFLGRMGKKLVAIKCGMKSVNGFKLRDFLKEALLQQAMNCSGCSADLYGVCHIDFGGAFAPLALVMEFCGEAAFLSSRTLRDAMRAGANLKYTAQQWLALLEGVVNCLQVAHSRGISLNDVKSDNFVYHESRVLVIDFGLACRIDGPSFSGIPVIEDQEHLARVMKQCSQFAPELLTTGWTNEKTDVYGVGWILTEISGYMGHNEALGVLIEYTRRVDIRERASLSDLHYIIQAWKESGKAFMFVRSTM